MGSSALADLELGLQEVRALRAFRPKLASNIKVHTSAEARIAHQRATVVLLSSHYERFIYGLNESSIDHMNAAAIKVDQVPVELRLLQIRGALENVANVEWLRREDPLADLFGSYASHWTPGSTVSGLSPGPVLEWMKSPKVQHVKRYFRYFGVPDVFKAVTRSEPTRKELQRKMQGLVDARNGIAHGDQTIQPSTKDITDYLNSVEQFCRRSDRLMSTRLADICQTPAPW